MQDSRCCAKPGCPRATGRCGEHPALGGAMSVALTVLSEGKGHVLGDCPQQSCTHHLYAVCPPTKARLGGGLPRPVQLCSFTHWDQPTAGARVWAPRAKATKPALGSDAEPAPGTVQPSLGQPWLSSSLGLGRHQAAPTPPAADLDEPGTRTCSAQTPTKGDRAPRWGQGTGRARGPQGPHADTPEEGCP